MKKIAAFVFILFFALVFILSYMFSIPESKYGNAVNLIGQIGLGVSILIFFIIPGKKRPPKNNNRQIPESN
jgi:hypothetical protein